MQPDRAIYKFLTPGSNVSDLADWMLNKTPRLVSLWRREYRRTSGATETLLITLGNFSYLFDSGANRLVGAFGVVTAHNHEKRDSSRQQGHPRPEIISDAKGHAIAHSLGGGFDINIFEQDSRLNRSEFRRLERLALACLPTFYFVRLIYDGGGVRPARIEQGLVSNNPELSRLELNLFAN